MHMRRTARICMEGKLNAQDIQNPHLCVSKHMRGSMGSSEDHKSHAYAWSPTHMRGKQREHATRHKLPNRRQDRRVTRQS
ncbi:hypothetical protein PIB30_112558, partial [Stylosanthes scabra]|nr:hypothetical protein [Stylosanthes scabra]